MGWSVGVGQWQAFETHISNAFLVEAKCAVTTLAKISGVVKVGKDWVKVADALVQVAEQAKLGDSEQNLATHNTLESLLEGKAAKAHGDANAFSSALGKFRSAFSADLAGRRMWEASWPKVANVVKEAILRVISVTSDDVCDTVTLRSFGTCDLQASAAALKAVVVHVAGRSEGYEQLKHDCMKFIRWSRDPEANKILMVAYDYLMRCFQAVGLFVKVVEYNPSDALALDKITPADSASLVSDALQYVRKNEKTIGVILVQTLKEPAVTATAHVYLSAFRSSLGTIQSDACAKFDVAKETDSLKELCDKFTMTCGAKQADELKAGYDKVRKAKLLAETGIVKFGLSANDMQGWKNSVNVVNKAHLLSLEWGVMQLTTKKDVRTATGAKIRKTLKVLYEQYIKGKSDIESHFGKEAIRNIIDIITGNFDDRPDDQTEASSAASSDKAKKPPKKKQKQT